MKDIHKALSKYVKDDALVRHFLSVWPVIESILEAFSRATKLPIFVYLNEIKVFQSSMETMPPFCAEMLNDPEMAALCTVDGLRRAKKLEPDIAEQIQYCHAGMMNGRREIDTECVGILAILFGSKKSIDDRAIVRRQWVIQIAKQHREELYNLLKQADSSDTDIGSIDKSDAVLMDAISDIIRRLISATVGFRSLSMNMAHELSLTMLGLGLFAKELALHINSYTQESDVKPFIDDLKQTQKHILTEAQLGLYIVRNFLSYISESRYQEVVKPKFKEIDMGELLIEMVDLHQLFAATKDLTFQLSGVPEIPKIIGSDMEIRRLFHNILNNTIKYSYHSIQQSQRIIRIRSRVPYDPGFRRKRFSICFENYGLGLSEDEIHNVIRAGFRGTQAIAEVPIGAGIGLSEAEKIMRAHNGEIKIRSKKLHESILKNATYLTTIELIFPFSDKIEAPAKRKKG